MNQASVQIGRFFSLQQGQVGQYLSARVLVVRSPFRPGSGDVCYFGFDHLNQAQKFVQSLAGAGFNFQLRRSQVMPQPYELRLSGHRDLARTLAYWDRRDQQRLTQSTPVSVPPANAPIPLAA